MYTLIYGMMKKAAEGQEAANLGAEAKELAKQTGRTLSAGAQLAKDKAKELYNKSKDSTVETVLKGKAGTAKGLNRASLWLRRFREQKLNSSK